MTGQAEGGAPRIAQKCAHDHRLSHNSPTIRLVTHQVVTPSSATHSQQRDLRVTKRRHRVANTDHFCDTWGSSVAGGVKTRLPRNLKHI